MDIVEIHKEIKECIKCPKLEPWRKFTSSAHGNYNSKFVIVSEAPGKKSINNGIDKFWTGQAGNRIRKILFETVKTKELEKFFYLTDIVKCLPPNNRNPYKAEINNCKNFLFQEINVIKPEYIIVFGAVALKYFMGNYELTQNIQFEKISDIHNDNGYIEIRFKNFILIPLLHPSRANQYMNYNIYKKHVSEVYGKLIKNAVYTRS